MTSVRYYEDLQLGQRFASPELRVSEAAWRDFAAAVLGAESGCAGPLLPRLLERAFASALTMKLLLASEMNIAGGLVGLGVEALDWPRSVRIGDRLRAESAVEALDSRPDRPAFGLVRLVTVTRSIEDGAVVQRMTSRLLTPSRPA